MSVWDKDADSWREATLKDLQERLDGGADINEKRANTTPLFMTVEFNEDPRATELLLNNGADMNVRGQVGNAPIHRAAQNRNPEVLKVLLNAGANIDVRNNRGDTPLHWGAEFSKNGSSIETIKILLNAGADINARDKSGNTPLHSSALNSQNHGEWIMALLKEGADATAKNNEGKMPIDIINYHKEGKDPKAYQALLNATHPSIYDDRQDKIKKLLVDWFYENFQDPAEGGLYHESKEGGYHGDIRDASDELQNKFPFAPDDIIMAAVEEIESHGGHQWTPIYDSEASLIGELNTLIDSAPEPKTAPTFALGDDNLFYITSPPDNQPVNRQDASLKTLRETIEALLKSRIWANTHPELTPIVEEYKEVISGDQVSISEIYWSGVKFDNAVQILKENLSFNAKLDLETALDKHGAYIVLDEEGRRLLEASATYRQSAEQTEALKQASKQFADNIAKDQNLFDENVRKLVYDVLMDIGKGQYKERSNHSAGNTLTNLVSGIFKVVGIGAAMAIIGSMVSPSVPAMAASTLGTEAINAGWYFLIDKAPLLQIIAPSIAGESSWLASAADILERIRLMITRKK